MPRLYLIVRFETSDSFRPPYKTTDVTTTDIPATLSDEATRVFSTYTVIDEKGPSGPWIYRVAVEIGKVANNNVHISYGSVSHSEALQCLQSLPQYIKDSDKERVKGEVNVKAEIQWIGQDRLKVKLRKGSFLWYELVMVDVENQEEWLAGEEDADGRQYKKKKKVRFEEAVRSDVVI